MGASERMSPMGDPMKRLWPMHNKVRVYGPYGEGASPPHGNLMPVSGTEPQLTDQLAPAGMLVKLLPSKTKLKTFYEGEKEKENQITKFAI